MRSGLEALRGRYPDFFIKLENASWIDLTQADGPETLMAVLERNSTYFYAEPRGIQFTTWTPSPALHQALQEEVSHKLVRAALEEAGHAVEDLGGREAALVLTPKYAARVAAGEVFHREAYVQALFEEHLNITMTPEEIARYAVRSGGTSGGPRGAVGLLERGVAGRLATTRLTGELDLGMFARPDVLAGVNTAMAVTVGPGMMFNHYGGELARIGGRSDHMNIVGAGLLMKWGGRMIMGQRPSSSDPGLPNAHDMMFSTRAANRASADARTMILREDRAAISAVMTRVHGNKTDKELNKTRGYHPGWCPSECSAACPNSFRPNWFERLLGVTSVPGGPFDKRIPAP